MDNFGSPPILFLCLQRWINLPSGGWKTRLLVRLEASRGKCLPDFWVMKHGGSAWQAFSISPSPSEAIGLPRNACLLLTLFHTLPLIHRPARYVRCLRICAMVAVSSGFWTSV